MVKAIENLDVKLIVAGKFFDASFEEEIKSLKGWKKVDFRGFASRDEVKEILKSSIAGLVTLHPTPSYVEAYPVKMFEYMSAGVAVVASDFPLYREFVEGSRCGVCVDPLDVDKISDAILALLEDKRRVKEMGESGKEAIKRVYNWHNEEQKLIESYRGMLDG
jgi:glycosyltransferase involved in cell wall biosynthesis